MNLREAIEGYVKRVKELADHVRGNEQATRQSLIGPFFTLLGYDLTDPRECVPEYKADFGRDRSTKPIDWGFKINGSFAFFVEAKEVGRKLAGFDEQLADYFAKDPNVKLGILTNGVQWRFFTDVVNEHVMDREPFATWDVLNDEPPHDVFTLIQKSQFNPELIRTFAQRQRAQNLLVQELTRLLEPSSEFTKLAIANIETRNLTQGVVESWKPIVANAIHEWAKQRTLNAVLAPPAAPRDSISDGGREGKIETTKEELESFETIKKLLGPDRPVAYEDAVAYFKIHLAEKRTWVCARLQMDRKNPSVWVPLPLEEAQRLAPGRDVQLTSGWAQVILDDASQIRELGDLYRAAYAAVKASKTGSNDAT